LRALKQPLDLDTRATVLPGSGRALARLIMAADLRLRAVDSRKLRTPLGTASFAPDYPELRDTAFLAVTAHEPAAFGPGLRRATRWFAAKGATAFSLEALEASLPGGFDEACLVAGLRPHRSILLARVPVRRAAPPTTVRILEGPTDWEAYLRFKLLTEDHDEAAVRALVLRCRTLAGRGDLSILGLYAQSTLMGAVGLSAGGRVAYAQDLEVLPAWRGRGFGALLMQALEHEALRQGAQILGFAALERDWPRTWYQRLGYRQVGAVRSYVRRFPERLKSAAPRLLTPVAAP